MDPVRFYSRHGEYGCFSNGSLHRIKIGKLWFKTVEHYFNWEKWATIDPSLAKRIRAASSPWDAKRIAHSRRFTPEQRTAWERRKVNVMRRGLRAKFTQHKKCCETLLATGDAQIIEAAPNDMYWGEGKSRTGKNMLGKLYVELRTELRSE